MRRIDSQPFAMRLSKLGYFKRRVRLKEDFKPEILTEQIRKDGIQVNSIDLARSNFRDGRLVYTVVYSKRL